MSENLPAAVKPQIMAGGQVAALIPQSLDEAFRVSQAIAISGLAPKGIDRAEQIMVAIMAGAELGLAPFQSLQSFAVVNGRPTLWGDGLLAVVRGRGVRVREWLEGEGDGMVAHCECTRPDTGEQIARAFSVADAKKAGLWGKTGPWTQYPKRMLQMRARALSLRDGCADMLRGIQVREEVEDYRPIRNVASEPTGLVARLSAGKGGATEGFTATQAEEAGHDPETGEVIEDADFVANAEAVAEEGAAEFVEAHATEAEDEKPADDFPGDRQSAPQDQAAEPAKATLAERCAAFERRMGEATNSTKLKSIRRAADNLFDDMETSDPEGRVELAFRYEARLAELEDAERGAA